MLRHPNLNGAPMDRDHLARIIYEHWPDTFNYRRMTTATTQEGHAVTERAVGIVTWDECLEERPERIEDCRACADKIIEAMNTPGHPGDHP